MDNDDVDDYNNSDEEISEKHSQLLKSISKLDKGQRIKKPERNEPTLQVSEFHLVNSGITDKDAVCVDELVKTLGGRTQHKDIRKKFIATKKQAPVLQKPLEKPAAEKLKRAVGFEDITKELQKWDAIITRNRVATNQVFPLRSAIKKKPTNELVKRFTIQSELENELSALEPEKLNDNDKNTDEFSLTLEEIVQKRMEAAKFRAQQSYKHAKAHRQKKIKSKKFHRIERNAKVKEQLKEFAKLQETDPQGALEKLEELSKARAEERMSLKHKNTSKWAKNKQIRAKYDKESRAALAQQLSISRELMQKVKEHDNSDDETMENNSEALKLIASSTDNPWVNSEKSSSEIDDFISGFRKYWEKKHEADKNKNSDETVDSEDKSESMTPNKKVKTLKNLAEKTIEQNINIDEQNSNGIIELCNGDNKKSKIKKKKQKNITITSEDSNMELCKDVSLNVDEKSVNTPPKKVKNVVKKAGTSEWSIETVDNVPQSSNKKFTNSIAIDDIFDAMDDKIKQKVSKKLKKMKRKLAEIPIEESEIVNDLNHDNTDLSFKKMKLRPELDEALDETTGEPNQQNSKSEYTNNDFSKINNSSKIDSATVKKSVAEIDPNEFINAKSKHSKKLTINNDEINNDDIIDDDNEEDEEGEIISQQNIITEAFADDDVVDEFIKEKADEIKKSQLDNIDMRLPGWGSWGGKNIKQSLKKKRRFILKFPENPPRKDENKGNVIIIQDNSNVKKHQVNDLPYPFNSVSDFETSIRAPIGRNFIPENAHKRLIEPAVKTKIGKIIEPMNEDVLVEKKNIRVNGPLFKLSKKHENTKKKYVKKGVKTTQ